MKKLSVIVLLVILAGLFTACPSTGNITLNSLTSDEFKKIEDIEYSFLAYRHEHKISLLDSIERGLNNFMKEPIMEKPVKAQLYAMYAELYYYKNETALMEQNLQEAEILDPNNARLCVVKSIIEKDDTKKKTILEKGYKNAADRSLIALFLAEIHFAAKEYAKALPYYDEAFQGLSKKYLEYYQKNRDAAFHFMGNSSDAAGASDIATEGTLQAGQAASYLLKGTTYLDSLTFDKNLSDKNLIELLKEKGFIANPDLTAEDPLKRKDCAVLTLHIVAYFENDEKLINATSDRYKLLNKKSPISDVDVSDYYFDAVYILVEKEIMNLPDGINFFPDKAMSGIEFLEVIDRLKSRYGGM